MKARRSWSWIFTCSLAALLVGCGESSTDVSTPDSRIHFEPTPGALESESCTRLEFRAEHSGDAALVVQYWLDDELVGETDTFTWDELPPGEFILRAEARTAEGDARSATWTLRVEGPECEPPESDIFFFPESRELELEPFTTVLFRASHRELEPIQLEYLMDGETAIERRLFEWTAGLPGQHVMRATARKQDGEEEHVEWSVRVLDRVSTPVPKLEHVEAERLKPVGQVRIQWRRVYDNLIQVPITRHSIYVSTEPIVRVDSPAVTEYSVANDPIQRLQSAVLTDLTGGMTYHFRIRSHDLMDRQSELSEEASAYVTGLFEITGRCLEFSPATLLWMPASGIELRWQDSVTHSSIAGKFRFSQLSDYDSARLYLSDPRARLAPMRSEELNSLSSTIEFHALPLVSYFMDLGDGSPSEVALPRLLRIFSRRETNVDHRPKPIYRWEEYPVKVHAIDFDYLGNTGELVEYRPIFEEAVAAWNMAAGRLLFESVDSPPESGVVVSVDLTHLSGLLGQTTITRPYRSDSFREPPEEITIRLRSFNTVDLARRIIVHELGHALLLGHSPDPSHVMNGAATQYSPTDLEGKVVAFLSVMPQGIDLNRYRD